MTIGEMIFNAREARKWSQRQLAEKLGTTRHCVGGWENERHVPGWASCDKIAEVLGIPVATLAAGRVHNKPAACPTCGKLR